MVVTEENFNPTLVPNKAILYIIKKECTYSGSTDSSTVPFCLWYNPWVGMSHFTELCCAVHWHLAVHVYQVEHITKVTLQNCTWDGVRALSMHVRKNCAGSAKTKRKLCRARHTASVATSICCCSSVAGRTRPQHDAQCRALTPTNTAVRISVPLY